MKEKNEVDYFLCLQFQTTKIFLLLRIKMNLIVLSIFNNGLKINLFCDKGLVCSIKKKSLKKGVQMHI